MFPFRIYEKWPMNPWFNSTEASVTLPQLAATLPQHKVELFDGHISDLKFEKFKKKIGEFDIIGMGLVSPLVALNTELNVGLVKRVNPDVKVVLGGHHATFFDREWVGRGVDFVVRGEGELTLPELVRTVEKGGDLSGVRGITYRDGGGRVRVNPDRPFIEDLDSLPLPSWDLLDLTPYRHLFSREGFTAALETSRGCPSTCSFCLASAMWRHSQRYKSVDRIIEELKLFDEMNITDFYVIDDNFGFNYERNMALFKRMSEEGFDFNWGAYLTMDTIVKHPDFIEESSKSGNKFVMVGFESPRSEMWEAYKKKSIEPVDIGFYRKVYNILKSNGIFVYGFMIAGHPEESVEEASRVFDMAFGEDKPFLDYPAFMMLIPYPHTDFYDEMKKKGLLTKDMFYHNLETSAIKGQDKITKTLYRKFLKYFFKPKRMLKVFSKDEVERDFFRWYYEITLKGLSNVRMNNFTDFINFFRYRNLTEQERQDKLVSKYLSNDFIDRLCD